MKSEFLKITNLDWFFISYDEPNAEANWSHLQERVPWANRVHGIKGFDAAHRRCGELSETDWLVTVDGDTRIHDDFLEVVIEVDKYKSPRNFCYTSKNNVNGLIYGNGGLKVWHKPFISRMAFHELGSGMDFCWHTDYKQMGILYSDVYINGSPQQAFRAGYREGVKLTTLAGSKVSPEQWNSLPTMNKVFLTAWCNFGREVNNGIYSILGAITGVVDQLNDIVSEEDIRDYNYLDNRLKELLSKIGDYNNYIDVTLNFINEKSTLNLTLFSKDQSEFINKYYILNNG